MRGPLLIYWVRSTVKKSLHLASCKHRANRWRLWSFSTLHSAAWVRWTVSFLALHVDVPWLHGGCVPHLIYLVACLISLFLTSLEGYFEVFCAPIWNYLKDGVLARCWCTHPMPVASRNSAGWRLVRDAIPALNFPVSNALTNNCLTLPYVNLTGLKSPSRDRQTTKKWSIYYIYTHISISPSREWRSTKKWVKSCKIIFQGMANDKKISNFLPKCQQMTEKQPNIVLDAYAYAGDWAY